MSLPAVGNKAWPQIAVTFGIWHLIEYGNGRVELKFTREHKHHWTGSSFARTAMPDLNDKVIVQEDDIRQSHEAMKTVANDPSSALSRWTPV
ncbi:hypothetical protein [Rhodopirellula baltica]